MKILILFLILSLKVWSNELVQAGPGARSMGMGGTQISFITGAESLYINPAYLQQLKGFDFLIAKGEAAWSTDAQRLVEQYSNSSTTLGPSDLANLANKNNYADVTAKSAFAMPYFAVGAYSSNYLMEIFRDLSSLTYNTHFISDYGYAIGGSFPLGDMIQFGVTGRHVKRWGGQKELNIATLIGSNDRNQLESNFTEKGFGNALDLAMNLKFSGNLNPTLSFVWRDVGRTTFTANAGVEAPPSQPDNLIFGASLRQDAGAANIIYAFEYKNITTQGEDIVKKLHMGLEASFGLIDLRVGCNQSYLTYGLGIDLWLLKVDAAFYSEEIGAKLQDIRNDRYIVSATLQLNFDDAFNLLDKQGKKRRLKQRR